MIECQSSSSLSSSSRSSSSSSSYQWHLFILDWRPHYCMSLYHPSFFTLFVIFIIVFSALHFNFLVNVEHKHDLFAEIRKRRSFLLDKEPLCNFLFLFPALGIVSLYSLSGCLHVLPTPLSNWKILQGSKALPLPLISSPFQHDRLGTWVNQCCCCCCCCCCCFYLLMHKKHWSFAKRY